MVSQPILPLPGLVLIRPQVSTGTPLIHENVLWFSGAGATGLTVAQLTAIQSTFDPAFLTFFKTYASVTASYKSCDVQDYSAANGLGLLPATGYSQAGLSSGILPDNVSWLLSMKTSERYRGGHGRAYFNGIGSTLTDGHNNLASNAGAPMLSAWQSLVTAMAGVPSIDGGPYNHVVYRNRRKPGANHVIVPNGYVVNNELSTQRRRLRKAPHH